ncbi:MAG: acyltransferase, partial [Anaerolineae bacterium]|nr:acyltransferase [Anaerolineae bacterium]
MSTSLPVAASQPPSDRVYFPGLNGIRALAAFSVLIAHTYEFKWRMGIVLPPDYPRFLFTGLHAVIIFFVLSGFLITYLLLVEIHKTGTVSVPKFYLRRALRIWPVYYVTVFFGLIVIPLIVQASGFTGVFVPEQINGIQWVLYLLLAPNAVGFFGTPSSITAQLWSIGIEEQFYIIWPVLSKIFARRMLVALIGVIAFK